MKRRLALAAVLLAAAAQAQQSVQVQSLDAGVALPGFRFPADASRPAPAMLLHGCGGAHDGRGRLAQRLRDDAALFNRLGVHALVTDALTPRGETELCTQRAGSRRVTQRERRRDALGALAWLAAQPGVDPARIGLIGWSDGGSTVLAATNRRQREVAASAVRPSLAVAFHPGCATEAGHDFEATAPLLLLVGDADDWTPAEPCRVLAEKAGLGIETYPGAFHGFDGTAAVRLRGDVPNGVHPGQGVHVGTDAAARAASQARLERHVRAQWRL